MTPIYVQGRSVTDFGLCEAKYVGERNKHLSHRPNQGTEKVIFFPSLSLTGYMESVEMV